MICKRRRANRCQLTRAGHQEGRDRPVAFATVGVAHEQLRWVGRPELRAEWPGSLGCEGRARGGDEQAIKTNVEARDRRGVDDVDDELVPARVEKDVIWTRAGGQRDG